MPSIYGTAKQVLLGLLELVPIPCCSIAEIKSTLKEYWTKKGKEVEGGRDFLFLKDIF
jgi:hypothetical protein